MVWSGNLVKENKWPLLTALLLLLLLLLLLRSSFASMPQGGFVVVASLPNCASTLSGEEMLLLEKLLSTEKLK